MRMSPRTLDHARAFLRALASARQVHGLYPAGHPNRRQALSELLVRTRGLLDAQTDPPVLFVARHSLYLGRSLLARESLSLFRLVEAFERAPIHAVEISREVGEDDLEALLGMLAGERPVTDRVGGLVLNRLEPEVVTGPAEDLDLTSLRRAYAAGLETLRDTALRVASGRNVDLDAATAVVDNLADEVMNDPSHALLLTTVKSYDEYTYYHMMNVCLLSIALGQAIGLRRDQVITLGLGGLLHDVGKVTIPEDVLFHVGTLSAEQWRIVQQHPIDGAGLVFATAEGLYHPAATVVLEHHAAYDLSGYPSLTHRAHPSVPARLVSVVDCFDAVTSKRSYRSPAGRRQALEIIESGSGRGFDPRLVRIFTSLLGLFPVGSLVELDSGETGLVVDNHPERLSRPKVLIVLDAAGNTVEPEERDLTATAPDGAYRWRVVRAISPDTLGIDVVGFLTTGELELDRSGNGGRGGLVHEPSFGEAPPEGYVDTHNAPGHGHRHGHGHEHGTAGRAGCGPTRR
jgi:HD-GYP domain-containing protein (c-di-GMP phosphodiesterase class II)